MSDVYQKIQNIVAAEFDGQINQKRALARITELVSAKQMSEWIPVSERLPTGEEPNGILLDVGDDVWFLMGHRARNKAEKDYAVCWFECPPSPTPQENNDET